MISGDYKFRPNFNFVLRSVIYLSVSETWFHVTWCEWGIRSLITLNNINSHFIDGFNYTSIKKLKYFVICRKTGVDLLDSLGHPQLPLSCSQKKYFFRHNEAFFICSKRSRSKYSNKRKVWCLRVRLLVCNATVSKIVPILVRS